MSHATPLVDACAAPAAARLTTAHRICPLCEACCGLELTLEAGRVKGVRGHAADIFSAGYICPKGYALKDLHEDPDRLRQPLVKRDGRFVAVGWDEAFAEIQRRLPPLLAAHGRDAVALSIGNPSSHKMGLILYLPRLLKALGTKNFYSASTLDQMPKQLANGLMYGHWLSMAVPDIERTDWLLVIGANPAASNGSLWTVPDFRGKAKALRARGGLLTVIDPRRTETAELADAHHFIRPGTDVHLLLGMVHTLFDEGLVRLGRLAPHVAGLDALANAVRPHSAEHAAAHCGIPSEVIRTLARALATTGRAAVYARIGTCTQRHGSLCSWLVDVLNVLSGHLDEPGGAMFPLAAGFATNAAGTPGRGRGIVTGRHHSRVSGAPEVFGEFPANCLAEEIETAGPGQVRALVTLASNPVLSAPNGARLAAALETLDFMVSVDIYLNETTRHADVILPGRSALEDGHWDVAFTQFSWRNHARYSAPVLPAPASHPPEWQVLLRLAAIARGDGAAVDVGALDDAIAADEVRRVAGTDAAAAQALLQAISRWKGPERLVDLALRTGPYAASHGLTLAQVAEAEGGIDLGPLSPRLPELLRTPSGRLELAPPALLADLAGVAAEAPATAATGADGTLRLIGRRDVRSNNSWMHNLPTLAKGPQRCTLLVHPDDARRLGLRDGGRARLSRLGREIVAPVQLSDALMPGVASLPHGWGHDLPGAHLGVAAERPGVNLNVLMDEGEWDPLSGNAVLSGVEVGVRAVDGLVTPSAARQAKAQG